MALVEVYSYTCKRKKVELTYKQLREEVKRVKSYSVVLCQKCCNVPVYHLVYRDWEERDGNSNQTRQT